jgi:hypothetical protein
VLGSGDVVGRFRRDQPARPLSFTRGATLIGGPFRNAYFVERTNGLNALRWRDGRPAFVLLIAAHPGTSFAVAGLGNRLYAASGSTVTAVDLRTHHIAARYAIRCPQLHAAYHTNESDVLVCDNSSLETGVSQLFAVSTVP